MVRMSLRIEDDRTSQLLLAADKSLSYDEARGRLEQASLNVTVSDPAQPWAQAALLAIAASGTRMFRGGVFFNEPVSTPLLVGARWHTPLGRAMQEAGYKVELAPRHAIHLHVGASAPNGSPQLYCWANGWHAHTAPHADSNPATESNVLAGIVSGAMAVAEAFRRGVLNDALACRRPQSFDLWPEAKSPAIAYLPKELWFLGLGNLGQAALFALSLLPFSDPAAVTLQLQDDDVVGRENLPVQVLTTHNWVGQRKARAVADWVERRGFTTRICERRFVAGDRVHTGEPRIAIVGVDNLEARHAVVEAGFDFLVDAGLGATGNEAFDIRVHAFPGTRDPKTIWPDVAPGGEQALPEAYQKLVDAGRLDRCGAVTIAGQSVGVPCTALAAGAMQLTQVCRAIADGVYADRVDLSLRDTSRAVSSTFSDTAAKRIVFVRSA
jgi:hypothetical protein